MKKKQTPLEKLLSDKASLSEQCLRQEQKLGDTLAYVREHSGRLLLSGLSGTVFPGSSSPKEQCSVGKAALPLVWNIARPILVAWGISKIQSLLLRRLKQKN
jgi:hypothetical protein